MVTRSSVAVLLVFALAVGTLAMRSAIAVDAPALSAPRSTAAQSPAAQAAAARAAALSRLSTADQAIKEAAADGKSDSARYELKYKFRLGEVLRSEVVHRATIENTIKDTSQTAEMRTKSVKAWKVTEATPDHITFVHAVESVDMWQRTQGHAEVTYNSQTDAKAPPGYEAVAAAVGVPLTVITMDHGGAVLKREEKHPQPDMQSPPITIPLPKGPVPLGHVWTAPLEVDVLVTGGQTRKIHTQQHFTLEKVIADVATIQIETQVLTPINDATIEAQLVQRLTAGELKFDIANGRVVGQQLDLDRRVIGCAGAGSSMHYLMRLTEKPLPAADANTAKRPATKQR